MECCLQPRCSIDGEDRVIDEMFLTEFRKNHLGNCLISGRSMLHVQQSVRLGIDRSVQPEPFLIQLDHGFVNRNVIRICSIERLKIGLLYPVVNG